MFVPIGVWYVSIHMRSMQRIDRVYDRYEEPFVETLGVAWNKLFGRPVHPDRDSAERGVIRDKFEFRCAKASALKQPRPELPLFLGNFSGRA